MATDGEKLISKKYNLTKEIMARCLLMKKAKPKSWYKAGKKIQVTNRMQRGYSYTLTFDAGKNLRHGGWDTEGEPIRYPDFKPHLSPQQMLRMGVFEGKYCNDQIFEFPREWFMSKSTGVGSGRSGASPLTYSAGNFNFKRFSPEKANPSCNYFGVKSRQSLQEWRRKGWIPCAPGDNDKRGWFEWYCRYWIGRRQPTVDAVQIKRWKAFNRHYSQYLKHTKGHGLHKHPRRRQALLQWSYPSK